MYVHKSLADLPPTGNTEGGLLSLHAYRQLAGPDLNASSIGSLSAAEDNEALFGDDPSQTDDLPEDVLHLSPFSPLSLPLCEQPPISPLSPLSLPLGEQPHGTAAADSEDDEQPTLKVHKLN